MNSVKSLAFALAITAPVLPVILTTAMAQTPISPNQTTPAPTTPAQAAPMQAPSTQAPPAQAPSAQTPSSQVPAQAQAQPHARHQPRHEANRAENPQAMAQHIEQRINTMHQRLAITAQQEPAWNSFAQVMRDNAKAIEQAYRDRADHLQTMTAVDNLRGFMQLEQSRAQGLERLTTAFEPLYASFSDTQKKTADAMFRRQDERAGQRHSAKK